MAITVENAANCVPNTAFGETVLRVGHAQYSFAVDGGAVSTITFSNNVTIPANAIIYNVSINSTTACTSSGSGTMSLGTSAGSSTTSLVGATAVASFSSNAKVQGTPVPQTASTWVKMSAAGQITGTIGTATFTAGIIEIYVFYFVSST